MNVRTYGRRTRDADDNGDYDSFSLSQEKPSQQNFHEFHFSSQESSSFWPSSSSASSSSFDPDPYAFSPSSFLDNSPPPRKSKKPRKGQNSDHGGATLTSTLMEAQEFGEMVEHGDEVDFAVDGLRNRVAGGGGGVRIRRASLLSLLSICGTPQQRRNLRAQGTVKTIMEALLSLSLDDAPSNLAAAALLYLLSSDGQDDRMLDSSRCIRFLLKLLKPVLSSATEDKTQSFGCKLLGIGRNLNLNVSRDTTKVAMMDSDSSAAIIVKVEEILISCEEIKSRVWLNNKGVEKPESMSKFVALLIMEKACLLKISLEDTSGLVRNMDGNFKDKLRELGVLDAVFEVAMNCHSAIEANLESTAMLSLVMLLKCLKIMENATLMSKENQDHLLAMRKNSSSHGCRISFAKLIISVIKILSGLYLRSSAGSNNGVISISSSESDCCTAEGISQKKSTARLALSASMDDDNHLLKMRVRSSMFSSSSETTSNGSSRTRCNLVDSGNDSMCKDPFAFDEDDLEPSKWDAPYCKPKKSLSRAAKKAAKERQTESPSAVTVQEESMSLDGDSNSSVSDEELSSIVSECLLTTVKVLMNLTNENPAGCRQVGACRGLEALSLLIADHFPSFDSSSMKEGPRLTDQELDFLVAILGLLINLVEKDGQNRSRLASASISLAEGSEDESCKDVIPLLCSIFLAHQGKADDDQSEQGDCIQWDDEAAMLEGEKEAEKTIVEAYTALLLAFLSTESKSTRESIADCLPNRSVSCLVPVLERFVAFHLMLNVISPETHKAVNEVIASCRLP